MKTKKTILYALLGIVITSQLIIFGGNFAASVFNLEFWGNLIYELGGGSLLNTIKQTTNLPLSPSISTSTSTSTTSSSSSPSTTPSSASTTQTSPLSSTTDLSTSSSNDSFSLSTQSFGSSYSIQTPQITINPAITDVIQNVANTIDNTTTNTPTTTSTTSQTSTTTTSTTTQTTIPTTISPSPTAQNVTSPTSVTTSTSSQTTPPASVSTPSPAESTAISPPVDTTNNTLQSSSTPINAPSDQIIPSTSVSSSTQQTTATAEKQPLPSDLIQPKNSELSKIQNEIGKIKDDIKLTASGSLTESLRDTIKSATITGSGSISNLPIVKKSTITKSAQKTRTKVQAFSPFEQRCLRGSLVKRLQNSYIDDEQALIFSVRPRDNISGKIVDLVVDFLTKKGVSFRTHKIIRALSFRLRAGDFRQLIQDLLKNKEIAQNADDLAKHADNKTPSDEPLSRCPFYAEPDEILKIRLDSSTEYAGSRDAEDNLNIIGRGVKVAVLDTGVNPYHDCLKGQVVDAVDYTGEGIVDQNGHGTHVAGIVACKGSAYRGNAPGAKIINVKTTNKDGEGTMSATISGIEWAIDHSAKILNISLGALIDKCDGTDALSRAVDAGDSKGSLIIVAAGNFGPNPKTVATPGCAKRAFTVGAVNEEGKIADFSSRGPTADGRIKPDIFGPGVEITSSWYDGEYAIVDGTSQASPHVAGIAALVLEANPDLTNEQIKEVLLRTSDRKPEGNPPGPQGIINAYKAVSQYIKKTEINHPKEEEPIKKEESEEDQTNKDKEEDEETAENEEIKQPIEPIPDKKTEQSPAHTVEVQESSELIITDSTIDESFTFTNNAEDVTDVKEAVSNLDSCQLSAGSDSNARKLCSTVFIDSQVQLSKDLLPAEEKTIVEKIEQTALTLAQVSNKLTEDAKNELRIIADSLNKTVVLGDPASAIENKTNEIIKKIEDGIVTQIDISTYKAQVNEQKMINAELKYLKQLIPFKDVEEYHWFNYFVDNLKKQNIISGYQDNKGNLTGDFGPGNVTTVAEAIKMSLESAGIGQSKDDGTPKTIKARNHWAKKYYLEAEKRGFDITSNFQDNPNRNITRQEFTRLILETFRVSPLTKFSPVFTDVDHSSDFAGWIYQAYKDLIISGDAGKSTFRPFDSINRAEISKIIVNSRSKYGK